MLMRMIGEGSSAAMLKEGLSASSSRARTIADRVANASTPGSGFADALDQANGDGGVDLEKEMVSLADEQIRFEATSQLLQKVYAQIRASVHG
jgi:flagellar basal body rod protein FlgB